MHLPANMKIRSWLMGVATAGVLGPALTLGQTNESPLPAEKPRTPAKRQVVRGNRSPDAGFVTPAGFQVTDGGMTVAESEVEYQLRLLYERDGREMPDMSFATPKPQATAPESTNENASPVVPAAPVTGIQPNLQQNAQPVARPPVRQQPMAAPPPRKPPVPNPQAEPAHTGPNKISKFFKKIIPGSGSKAPHQVATVPPRQMPAPGMMPSAAPNIRTAQASPGVQKQTPLRKPMQHASATAPQPQQQRSAPSSPAPRPVALATAPQTLQTTPVQQVDPLTESESAAPLATITPSATTAPPMTVPDAGPVEVPAEVAETTTPDSESLASFIPPSPAPPNESAQTPVALPQAPAFVADSMPVNETATEQAATQAPPAMIDDFPNPFPEEQTTEPSFEQPAEQNGAPVNGLASQPSQTPFAATPSNDDGGPSLDASSPSPEETFEAPIVNPYSGKSLEEPATLPESTPLNKPTSVPSKAVPLPAKNVEQTSADDNSVAAKMRRIIQRADMTGLKGFCPVTLRDQRELADSVPDYVASHRGQKFYFATQAAQQKFEQHPERYAPAAYGADVVVLTRDQDVLEGTLDHAAWYRGRLYLFANQENHDIFVKQPERYASPPGIE
ncbi:MAG: hypothetical protein U0872_16065 [Planctomycetaceae bacterium]